MTALKQSSNSVERLMIERITLVIVAGLLLSLPFVRPANADEAAGTVVKIDDDELAIDRGIGQPLADFTLHDTAGREVRLYGFAGKKAVVVVFIGTGCPVSNLYLPRLAELAQTYQQKGIEFVAVDSNRGSDAAKVAQHAREHGVSFPVLMDPGNVVADRFHGRHLDPGRRGATRRPHGSPSLRDRR
jgi:peroxiredoxin